MLNCAGKRRKGCFDRFPRPSDGTGIELQRLGQDTAADPFINRAFRTIEFGRERCPVEKGRRALWKWFAMFCHLISDPLVEKIKPKNLAHLRR